jgi:hypothetical protein
MGRDRIGRVRPTEVTTVSQIPIGIGLGNPRMQKLLIPWH